MQGTRLNLYYNYLTNFDFLDKELHFAKTLLVTPRSDHLVIRSKVGQQVSEKYIISKALILELFGNQKFLVNKTNTTFSKNLTFELTLRRNNLFLLLDSCLNTVFLHEHNIWTWDNIYLQNKLHFYLSTNLMIYFNLVSTSFRYSFKPCKLFVSLNETSKSKSFYLIPKTRRLRRIA